MQKYKIISNYEAFQRFIFEKVSKKYVDSRKTLSFHHDKAV